MSSIKYFAWPHVRKHNLLQDLFVRQQLFHLYSTALIFFFFLTVLFSSMVFIYSRLFLNHQSCILDLSLLPEMWDSQCPSVLVFVLVLSRSPGFLPLALVIQEDIYGVFCHGQFLIHWKINQHHKIPWGWANFLWWIFIKKRSWCIFVEANVMKLKVPK